MSPLTLNQLFEQFSLRASSSKRTRRPSLTTTPAGKMPQRGMPTTTYT